MDGGESAEQDWKARYDELMRQYVSVLRAVDDGAFMALQNLVNLIITVKQLRWRLESGE
ncbi:MAG: hypothetical protein QW692_04495 [Nitrososphaerota archaeon]